MIKEAWKIPKMWPGETVTILGGGPSLLQNDLSLLKGRRVIAVNQTFELGYFDICFFGDMRWFRQNHEGLRQWPGLIINCVQGWFSLLKGEWPSVKWLLRGKRWGLEDDPRRLSWNFCSGSAAIDLAHHLGATKILLLGFEMHANEKMHYHDKYPELWEIHIKFKKYLTAFPYIKRDADRKGIEIINCTPDSAIKEFPVMGLEEALNA